jgi:hypothetical protein
MAQSNGPTSPVLANDWKLRVLENLRAKEQIKKSNAAVGEMTEHNTPRSELNDEG